MYKLERVRKCKIVLGILTLIFFALSFLSFGYSRANLTLPGYVSLFCAIDCIVGIFVISTLEKDIAEWLGILENRINDKKS